jgi:Sulfotransferase family
VLKSPIHIGNLVTLQRVFPGARIVHCHRSVEVSMASMSSVDILARKLFVANVEPKHAGAGALAYWGREWDRNIADRPRLAPGSYCDIRFEDIDRNAMAVAETIFDFAGVGFDGAGRDALQKWEAANPRHQGGKHDYDGSEYGVTRETVAKAFAVYLDYFADKGIFSENSSSD